MRRILPLVLLAIAGCATTQPAAAPVPYIDAHSHVLPDYSLEAEAALMREAGLAGFVLMDPRTDMLRQVRPGNEGYASASLSIARLPQMPGLRLGPDSASAMTAAIDQGFACGFGEIPTRIVPRAEASDAEALVAPDRMAIYRAANTRGVPVNLHVDIANPEVEAAISSIAREHPRARIVLAHAGWSAPAQTIARLMDAHPNIMADLSVRLDPAGGLPASPLAAGSMPPGAGSIITFVRADGSLEPEWRDLLVRHSDRFLFAMDLTEHERPRFARLLLETARKALSPLGARVENAVAHGNIERLFAGCPAGFVRRP